MQQATAKAMKNCTISVSVTKQVVCNGPNGIIIFEEAIYLCTLVFTNGMAGW